MMNRGFIAVFATILIFDRSYAGQQCLSCSGVEGGEECQHFVTCSDEEVCFMHNYVTESGSVMYDYGCGSPLTCHHSIGPIVGRRSEGHDAKCTICCNDASLCNRNLNCSNLGQTPPNYSSLRECSDIKQSNPASGSGVYTIYPDGTSRLVASVYCKVESGHSWTVIQRRYNGSVDFYRNWQAYKDGFGSPYGEYWLGNEIIHELTSHENHDLRIEMEDFDGVSKYAEYTMFIVGDEQSGYRLSLANYRGNAGDSLLGHNGMKFSTYDKDNDTYSGNCATAYKGAWWYAACHTSNLNGKYLSGHHDSYADGINWYTWHGQHYSLKSVTMMIRKY